MGGWRISPLGKSPITTGLEVYILYDVIPSYTAFLEIGSIQLGEIPVGSNIACR
jgi:hypothetical protein